MAFARIRGWLDRKSGKTPTQVEEFVPDPALINLCVANILHVGVPSDLTPFLAYDQYQGLLAVGTLSGLIKVYAQDGIESVLRREAQAPIAHLAFAQNQGLIYVVGIDDVLVVWDLRTRRVKESPVQLTFRCGIVRVTCLYVPDQTAYVYLGTEAGELRVFNSEKFLLTTFCLSYGLAHTQNPVPAAVTSLRLHPTDPQLLLIAYEERPAIVWNLKSGKPSKTIEFSSPIHSIEWLFDGSEIVAGLRDGNLAFWQYPSKDAAPKKLMRVDPDLEDRNVSAVDKIISVAAGLLVNGGQPFSSTDSLSFIPVGEGVPIRIPLPSLLYAVLSAPLIQANQLIDRAFVLTEQGSLLTIPLVKDVDHTPVYFRSILGPGRILKSCLQTVASDGIQVIDFLAGFTAVPDDTLTGGMIAEELTDCFGVYLTAHENGLVHLWRVSKLRLVHMQTLCLQSEADFSYGNRLGINFSPVSPDTYRTITCLDFNISEKVIIIGSDLGFVTAWRVAEGGFQMLYTEKVTASAVTKCVFFAGSPPIALFGDISANVSAVSLLEGTVLFTTNCANARPRQNVLISDMVTFSDLHLAVIGVSNGSLSVLDLSSFTLLPDISSPHADLTSETPKSSEFGIVKLLPVMPMPGILIVCYEKAAFLLELPELKASKGVTWSVPVFSAAVNLFNTQAYLSLIDREGLLSLWSLPELVQKWRSPTVLPMKCVLSSLEKAQHFMMSMDGHFFIDTFELEVGRGWLTFEGSESDESVGLHLEGIDATLGKPPPKRKSLFGIKFSTEVNYSHICTLQLVDKPERKCTIKLDSEETKSVSRHSVPAARISEATSELEHARTSVLQRGEKLSRLEQNMQKMADQAKSMATMVEEYNRAQENKKWWQFCLHS